MIIIGILKSVIIFLLLSAAFCAKAQQAQTIRVDPSNSFGGSISEYFDNVEYILLETNKESLFGEATQMIITDSSIVISDFDTRAVLFFTKQGRYIKKVRPGNHPNIEYNHVGKYLVVRAFNKDLNRGEEKYYGLTGNAISELPSKTINALRGVSLGNNDYLNPVSCCIRSDKGPMDTVMHFANIYSGDTLHKYLLPVVQTEKMAVCAFSIYFAGEAFPSTEKGIVYMATPIEHDVYAVTKDTAIKKYRFVFPAAWSFPKRVTESKDFKFLDSLRKAKPENANVVLKLSNILKTKDLLFFRIITRNKSFASNINSTDTYNFIFHLKSGKLSCLERILPDATVGYLPFYNWNITMLGLDYNKNDGFFYTSVSSLEMFKAYEKNKFKSPQLPSSTIEYFKTQNIKSNPVIVRFKIKNQEYN